MPDDARGVYFVRRFFSQIVLNRTFVAFIHFSTVVNCVFLAFENPMRSKDETISVVIEGAEMVFLIIFGVEMLMKMAAFGVWESHVMIKNQGHNNPIAGVDATHHGYFRSGWNRLDFVIVMGGVVAYLPDTGGTNFSTMRVLRVLRPLRTLHFSPSMRVVIETLMASCDLIMKTLLILVFFILMFGILGVQLFAGQLNINGGMSHYNDIGGAVLVVFHCVTLEGWVAARDALVRANGSGASMYFFIVIFFGSFFLLNLTISVFKSGFAVAKLKVWRGRHGTSEPVAA
jgi:hypothetical protein